MYVRMTNLSGACDVNSVLRRDNTDGIVSLQSDYLHGLALVIPGNHSICLSLSWNRSRFACTMMGEARNSKAIFMSIVPVKSHGKSEKSKMIIFGYGKAVYKATKLMTWSLFSYKAAAKNKWIRSIFYE